MCPLVKTGNYEPFIAKSEMDFKAEGTGEGVGESILASDNSSLFSHQSWLDYLARHLVMGGGGGSSVRET